MVIMWQCLSWSTGVRSTPRQERVGLGLNPGRLWYGGRLNCSDGVQTKSNVCGPGMLDASELNVSRSYECRRAKRKDNVVTRRQNPAVVSSSRRFLCWCRSCFVHYYM